MSSFLTVYELFPSVRQQIDGNSNPFNTTFVGIDFGTSTTVATIAVLGDKNTPIKTETIWTNQLLKNGHSYEFSDKLPSVIAWYKGKLLIGRGAADMKYFLKPGVDVWYSFKMELGEDLGPKYFNTMLGKQHSVATITRPTEAAAVFFKYLHEQIIDFVSKNNYPENILYAVSIPASFEANQRRDLISAINEAGIPVQNQCLIDEPNAAFLSYVVHSNLSGKQLSIPEDYNLNVLVFDFGAGTCDVSILEVGKNLDGIYSKNLSISRFERLGGDDIDRLIVKQVLLPQFYAENKCSEMDFRSAQLNRLIIPKLMKPAEELKIKICKAIALQTHECILPDLAFEPERVSISTPVEVDINNKKLTLSEPQITFRQFANLMTDFTVELEIDSSDIHYLNTPTIFSPIVSALKKANLDKEDIDYVLLIGGSCINPYIQSSVNEYFKKSELIIPGDLQTHVSIGSAIHSLIFNGFNKNTIQPITSEPILYISKGDQMNTLLPAGHQIPCDKIIIDNLVPQTHGQRVIEIPICVSSKNKILQIIKIYSPDSKGFDRNTPIRLECEINADKLLLVQASVLDQKVFAEPMNPFANKSLTTIEMVKVKAEREANIDAENNGGKPSENGLKNLYEAYEKTSDHLKAAETLELLVSLYPNNKCFNDIGYHYHAAGHIDKAIKWEEEAHRINPTPLSAFNLAMSYRYKDKNRYEQLMEECLKMNPDYAFAKHYYGEYLMQQNNPRGKEMVQSAFNYFKSRFDVGTLPTGDYSRLIDCANLLGDKVTAGKVSESKPRSKADSIYSRDNLVKHSESDNSIQKL